MELQPNRDFRLVYGRGMVPCPLPGSGIWVKLLGGLSRDSPIQKDAGQPPQAREFELGIHYVHLKGKSMKTRISLSAPLSNQLIPAVLAALLLVAAGAISLGAGPQSDPDAVAMARLEWMPRNQTGMLNVSASEGAYLRDHVIKAKTKRALEIGTSNGYSTIWIALGVRKTGGHVTTLEISDAKVKLASENFRAAGVADLITLVHGDALKEIPKLHGPFEFVFIDAAKSDYVKYLDMVVPMVPPGGIIMAHNTRDLRYLLEDFIQKVTHHPQLDTVLVEPGPGGFSVSVKRAAK
jgi:caffeoyl-CoA O-methyltransferase